MKRWDVVLLAYPFDDWSGAKVRPALVVSSDEYNRRGEKGVFVLITSNLDQRSDFDMLVADSHPEFRRTGLARSSMVRVDMVWTLQQNLVRRTLGTVGEKIRSEVLARLRRLLPDAASI